MVAHLRFIIFLVFEFGTLQWSRERDREREYYFNRFGKRKSETHKHLKLQCSLGLREQGSHSFNKTHSADLQGPWAEITICLQYLFFFKFLFITNFFANKKSGTYMVGMFGFDVSIESGSISRLKTVFFCFLIFWMWEWSRSGRKSQRICMKSIPHYLQLHWSNLNMCYCRNLFGLKIRWIHRIGFNCRYRFG